jgi:chromosome segregation ATPase
MRASEETIMSLIHCHRARVVSTLLSVAVAFGVVTSAYGADDNKASKDKEMARRVQMLQQEKTALGAKLKEADSKTEELNKAVEQSKRGADRSARELAAARRSHAELAARLEKLEEEHKALQARFDETSTVLARRENEKRMLEGVAAEQVAVMGRQSRLIDTYRGNNTQLHRYGIELLDKLRVETKGLSDSLFGLAQVDRYNFDQDYRDKLNRLRLVEPEQAVR